jgi:hypothetical protein
MAQVDADHSTAMPTDAADALYFPTDIPQQEMK